MTGHYTMFGHSDHTDRNLAIVEAVAGGATLASVRQSHGITRERVRVIVEKFVRRACPDLYAAIPDYIGVTTWLRDNQQAVERIKAKAGAQIQRTHGDGAGVVVFVQNGEVVSRQNVSDPRSKPL